MSVEKTVATTTSGTVSTNPITTKGLFSRDDIRQKFESMLGKKAQGFIVSVLQIVNSSDKLKMADPMSIYNAAALAATLDLPLNNSLGFAYIIPFKQRYEEEGQKKERQVAQFQIGYKGFIQLAQRSGQVRTVSACPIYDGQIVEQNPLTGFVFDFTKKTSEKVIGYASYLELINGFNKTLYLTVEEMTAHGKKFSQTFKSGFGLWKDDFESMAIKTVLKLLLSKYAPMSIEMQKALIADQGIITDLETMEVQYSDHTEVQTIQFEDLQLLYDMKEASLSEDEKKDANRILRGKEELSYKKLHDKLMSK